jgi:hypothetical protein
MADLLRTMDVLHGCTADLIALPELADDLVVAELYALLCALHQTSEKIRARLLA